MTHRIAFTQTALERLEAVDGKRTSFHDTKIRGLIVMVRPTGHKRFYLYRKVAGCPLQIALGHFPDMTVHAARALAEELNADIAAGRDPLARFSKTREKLTFGELFAEYIERHSKPNNRSWREDQARYDRHLKGRLANKRLSAITDRDMVELYRALFAKTKVESKRVMCLVSSVFNRAAEWKLFAGPNPCKGLKMAREKPRRRYLASTELRRFQLAVDDEPCDLTRDYIQISLYTGARQANVLQMRWAEIDFEEREWTIPAEKFKNGETQIVPLGPAVMDILRRRYQTSRSEWVLPASRSDSQCGYYQGVAAGWARVLLRAEAIGLAELIYDRTGESLEAVKMRVWAAVQEDRSKHAMKRSLKSLTQDTLGRLREEVRAVGRDPDSARIENLRMHDLRRTHGSWQIKTGASLYVAGKNLGQKDLKTTTSYAIVDTEQRREALEKAERAILAQKSSVSRALPPPLDSTRFSKSTDANDE